MAGKALYKSCSQVVSKFIARPRRLGLPGKADPGSLRPLVKSARSPRLKSAMRRSSQQPNLLQTLSSQPKLKQKRTKRPKLPSNKSSPKQPPKSPKRRRKRRSRRPPSPLQTLSSQRRLSPLRSRQRLRDLRFCVIRSQ